LCDVALASINFGTAPDLVIALSSREAKSSASRFTAGALGFLTLIQGPQHAAWRI
jgi:hypothetical protein